MENQPQNKNAFFLASFLPAVGYWILDAYFSLTVALIGGMSLVIMKLFVDSRLIIMSHFISPIPSGH